MSKIERAIKEINDLGQTSDRKIWINEINPTVKLFVTVLYLVITVSFPNNSLQTLLSMAVYPVFIYISADISFIKAVYRMRIVLPLVVLMGIFNPIFDRTPVTVLNGMIITSGMISGLTLIVKGFLTVFATYILVSTTSLEAICGSLKRLHFPDILVIQIMLTFRYLTVLLSEVGKVTQAYLLRAPNQKGIHFKAWGSLVGNQLLHSFDRAQDIYQAMNLRGFNTEYFLYNRKPAKFTDFLFLLACTVLFFSCRYLPLFAIIGSLFGGTK